jgi:type I restriction enzyme S subunit
MSEWEKTKISEFLFERKGRYKPNDELIAGLKRIVKIDFSGNFHIAIKPSQTNMILIKKDDLVISGINVAKGAMGIYTKKEDVVATIHYSSYTFDETKINVAYFKRFLKSAEFIRLIEEQIKGGIKTEIKPKHILPLEILLPSLDEQGLIVNHFESVEIEDQLLNSEISNQQNLLKKLRQQILQDAIEGKLTKDWREQNPDVEPASELLKRIQAEKEQLIKDKKIKKQKTLPKIVDDEKPFELPESWEWCRLNELSINIHYGATKSADHNKRNVRLLRITDIQNNSVNWSNVPGCEYTEKDLINYKLSEYDILIARTGGTIGKSYLVRDITVNSLFASYLIRVIPSLQSNPNFMKLYIESPFYWTQLISASGGSGQPNVSGSKLKELVLSVPTLQEQKEIVKKVEKLFAICDQLEKQITNTQTNAGQLMQSVLKESFSQDEKVA